jgi:hypothetical protein
MGGKIWGVWCKGVQRLVMGELKQIEDFRLKVIEICKAKLCTC